MYVHLHNQNQTQAFVGGRLVQIVQQNNYPWYTDVHLTVTTALASVTLPHDARLTYELDGNLFGGVGGDVLRIEPTLWGNELYQPESFQEVAQTPFTLKAIPYCFWANRQPVFGF